MGLRYQRRTVRMYTSKNTQRFPAAGRTAPDFKGAIGIKQSGNDTEPEGVDIVTPVLKLTATYRHPKNTIDLAYVNAVAGLSGRTNNAPFYGYAAGELLFLGCVGELIPTYRPRFAMSSPRARTSADYRSAQSQISRRKATSICGSRSRQNKTPQQKNSFSCRSQRTSSGCTTRRTSKISKLEQRNA